MNRLLITFCLLLSGFTVCAQYYPDVASYHFNGTTPQGVKIKTNIPFLHGVGMPLVMIKGYNYSTGEVISIDLVWYVYDNAFINDSAVAYGGSAPEIRLSNEGGKVVIHLSNNIYFQRFHVSAFALGKGESSTYFAGWTIVSEPVTGTATTLVPYKQRLAGTINLPGSSVWTSDGNVGIGTASPQAKLAVKGTILASEVKVKSDITVPDYVFEEDYDLPALDEIAAYVKEHKHLPEIPSAADIEREGLNLAEMNLLLLKKVEELTLHLIEQRKFTEELKQQHVSLRTDHARLKEQMEELLSK